MFVELAKDFILEIRIQIFNIMFEKKRQCAKMLVLFGLHLRFKFSTERSNCYSTSNENLMSAYFADHIDIWHVFLLKTFNEV